MDVHCDQLIDFLTKRGLLTSWQTDLQKIKNAFPEALALVPSDWTDEVEAGCTVPSAAMGYWRCREVFTVLLRKKLASGEASKTWLGSYKDPLLARWDLILRAYRARNVFLAESAVFLTDTAGYEIPGLKGELATCVSRLAHLGKRVRETDAQIARQRAELEAFCAQRGISGSAPTPASIVEDATRTTRAGLPPLLAGVHEKIRDPAVARGAELYRAFAEFMGCRLPLLTTAAASGAGRAGGDAVSGGSSLLPTLQTFCEYDGPVASAAELPDLPLSLVGIIATADGDGEGGGIDWGGLDGGGDGAAAGEEMDMEIDWDIGEEVAAAAAAGVAGEDDGGGSLAGIGGDDGQAAAAGTMADVTADGGGGGGGGGGSGGGDGVVGIEMDMIDELGAAFGMELGGSGAEEQKEADAVLVKHSLVDVATREALSNDLLELQSFLRQRVLEMRQDKGNEYFTLTRDAPAVGVCAVCVCACLRVCVRVALCMRVLPPGRRGLNVDARRRSLTTFATRAMDCTNPLPPPQKKKKGEGGGGGGQTNYTNEKRTKTTTTTTTTTT
jgi:hypothetical protein